MTLAEVIHQALRIKGLTTADHPWDELHDHELDGFQSVADAAVEFMAAEIRPLPKRKRRDANAT